MKILILANDYKTIANFREELLERLLEEKHEVYLSIPFDSRNDKFRDMGCMVFENKMTRHGTNIIFELKQIKEYKKLVKKIRPNVVLTYTIKPNVYGSIVCRKLKVPVINNITGLGSNIQKKGLKQNIFFFLMKYAMKKSDVIFFQNQENKELFNKRGVCGKQSVLLPGSGVNLNKHNFVEYPKENGKIKFITVSRLREDKGYDELLDAIKKLNDLDNLEFHIVGWSEERKYEQIITDMAQKYPVFYYGEKTQQEVHELIAKCHCIIHPSYHEGMANVLMEASAAGRPAIASNIAGCREIIDNFNTGFVFETKNVDSLVERLNQFMTLTEDERMNMGKNARKKMEKEFDRNIIINTYINFINKITS